MSNNQISTSIVAIKLFNQLRRRNHFPITDVAKIVTLYYAYDAIVN